MTSYLAIFALCALIYMIIDIWRDRDLWSALAVVVGFGVISVLTRFTDGHPAEIFFAIAIGVAVGVAFRVVVERRIRRIQSLRHKRADR